MPKLFLLKGGFVNEKINPCQKFFCTECATIEGLLSYFPQLTDEIEIKYIDYEMPRSPIVELIGEKNQSCPVLVFEDGTFINDMGEIMEFF